MNSPLSRRHFLRSATSLIALPALESLGFRRFAAAAAPTTGRPKRAVFLSIGFGVTNETWFPDIKQTGAGYTLSPGLAPLARHKASFTVVQGLTNKFNNEGHWGSTLWLTGANRYAEPGQTFHNSISADQVAAGFLGKDTRFTSVQLGSPRVELDGHGPGLSLAWDQHGKPVAGFDNPVIAFHRLFSSETTPLAERQAMLSQKRSILDALAVNAADLQRGLSKNDTHKLSEYFQSIRDIETRLSKDERWLAIPKPKAAISQPAEGLGGREEIKLMYDILVAALQTDSTRVVTYRQPCQSLLQSLGVQVDSHAMSHYTPGEKMEASQKRDVALSELLAGLIDKLKATQETDGTSLFDHTVLAFGSNIRSTHYLDNCPTLLAGGGAGFKLGQQLVLPKNTPLCNVWLSLLQGLGVPAQRHGDSTGVVRELLA
ncbi:MAG: hypothetical protein RLZZ142_1147 [Verrucomicrobiota bacterium]